MTSAALDALLADAVIPTSSRTFDVAAGLRRLAADAARGVPTSEVVRASHAKQRLNVVCRWVLNERGAAAHLDRLAKNTPEDWTSLDKPIQILPDAERRIFEDSFDIHGALVFACLLSLTNQPESAQFWWQLAAGAGNRIAAYCLHLHHLGLGESREAQHWYHQVLQVIRVMKGSTDGTDTESLQILNAMTSYVRRNGSPAHTAPPGGLEAEVDRLASRAPSGLVNGPDQQLADRLHDFASRR